MYRLFLQVTSDQRAPLGIQGFPLYPFVNLLQLDCLVLELHYYILICNYLASHAHNLWILAYILYNDANH